MIILASQSPRRKELLKLCGFDFEIKPADADETLPDGITPREAVCQLSKIKARAVNDNENIIIGADTVVALGNEILGKPLDEEDAFLMLKKLSGKIHSVFTGVTLIKKDKEITFAEETKVEFYPLTDEEIKDYIKTKEPMDKAGAYGIQGFGGLLVKSISGDYNNVVGLPVAKLNKEIKELLKIIF